MMYRQSVLITHTQKLCFSSGPDRTVRVYSADCTLSLTKLYQSEFKQADECVITWSKSYRWPAPSYDRETQCRPPAVWCQSITSAHRRTSAAPAQKRHSLCWLADALQPPTSYPMSLWPDLNQRVPRVPFVWVTSLWLTLSISSCSRGCWDC